MTESDYWLLLEYRLSREFPRLGMNELRFLWCDRLRADHVSSDGGSDWISGTALISEDDGRSFVDYRFRLRLGRSPVQRSGINWEAMLPGEETSGWLSVDGGQKMIEMLLGEG